MAKKPKKPKKEPLNAPEPAAEKKSLPPALQPYVWKPGQSGNPGGKGGAYAEMLRLARQATPQAIAKIITLIESNDERIAFVASEAIINRAYGKPKELPPDPKERRRPDLSSLTPKELADFKKTMAKIAKANVITLDDEGNAS